MLILIGNIRHYKILLSNYLYMLIWYKLTNINTTINEKLKNEFSKTLYSQINLKNFVF